MQKSQSKPDPATRPRSSAARDAFVLGGLALLLVGAVVWWATSGAGDSRAGSGNRVAGLRDPRLARYLGDRACRECHPGETASHSRSGHARTLRPAAARSVAKWLDGRSVPDPEQAGVSWTYHLSDGKLSVDRVDGKKTEHLLIEYAFGSGRHANTFVSMRSRNPDHPVALEHRLTFFAQQEKMGITPGQAAEIAEPETTAEGRVLSAPETLKCFDCHTTLTSLAGQSVLDVENMWPNISCERCHGPGRAHAEAARRGEENLAMPFGIGGWTASQQMELCGHCHRHPDKAPPSDIRTDNVDIVRFQPVGLMQSACYKKSQGGLSCVTCHEPHSRSSSDRLSYEPACLSCHQAADQVKCTISPGSGCIDCHMPRRDAGQGILFTDHWIRIQGGRKPATAAKR